MKSIILILTLVALMPITTAICNITATPDTIIFTTSGVKNIKINNNGNEFYDPEIIIIGDLKEGISTTSDIRALPDSEAELGIILTQDKITQTESKIILQKEGCANLEIIIKTEKAPGIITDIKDLTEISNIKTFMLKPVLIDKIPAFRIGMVFLILLFIWILVFYEPISKALSKFRFIFALFWVSLSLILSLILTIIIIMIARLF